MPTPQHIYNQIGKQVYVRSRAQVSGLVWNRAEQAVRQYHRDYVRYLKASRIIERIESQDKPFNIILWPQILGRIDPQVRALVNLMEIRARTVIWGQVRVQVREQFITNPTRVF